jgi:flotillin
MTGLIIAACVLVALLVLFFVLGYIKAPPDTAFIISGLGKRRILIGKAGWRMPFFTRLDKLSLSVMQVDVKTSEAVPTNEFINVTVDGVANIKISSDPALLERAAKNKVERIKVMSALPTLLSQVYRPETREGMSKTLVLLERLATSVSLYRLSVNMEPEAAEISYSLMTTDL